MTVKFEFLVSAKETEICLVDATDPVPFERWATHATPQLRAGVDLALRLEASGGAIAVETTLFVEHGTIAGLTAHEAALLGLPPSAEAVAVIATRGVITQDNYEVTLRWQRASGQPLIGPHRIGAWLQLAGDWRRLPEPLFGIAEAVDAARLAGSDPADRLTAVARLLELLPDAQNLGEARATGMLGQIEVHVADAFSRELTGEGEDTRLLPILHRAGGDPEEGLLPPPLQQEFAERHFYGYSAVRGVYPLGGAAMLVVSAPLRRALSVVHRHQSASPPTRRALFENPRLFLREALGDEEETLIDAVFRETPAYAERVRGLGLWQKRVVPWVQVPPTDWFNGLTANAEEHSQPGGLIVDGRRLELSPTAAEDLQERIERAIGTGEPFVELDQPDGPVRVPATHDVLTQLARLEASRTPSPGGQNTVWSPPEVLLIYPNEQDLAVEALVKARPTPSPVGTKPAALSTAPKVHQSEGLNWLQKAWIAGLPGVLLADDMGLGKTLQSLAFLAWLREGMAAGGIPREPLLIVAPTGLLTNWQKEHADHLASPGLGEGLPAFGADLRHVRLSSSHGGFCLDVEALRRADWVLTTYETLRDYDRDFGQVRFAAGVFDEAQKIKTPAIRLTDAAKAMNVGFRIAMTGTPVENRLSDLWCILDTANPGYLGDLKSFSRQFEQTSDADRLARLRASLDRPVGGHAPVMLRRLRREQLPDLPPLVEREDDRIMPPIQAATYESAIAQAQAGGRGDVLAALQRLRAVSLHPDPDAELDDEAFIAASARLVSVFATLDDIKGKGERALVFVDDLKMQARLAAIIQRRYGLPAAPMVINGTVAGPTRQARVDRFQSGPDGFNAMILSPRAGGVGLTLTRANHVIHLSRWWNPAVEDQCNGRALRIGQSRAVTAHLPIAMLGGSRASFDQNLHALLVRKRKLTHQALVPPEATDFEKEKLLRDTIEAK